MNETWALLSDVHGNLAALRQALSDARGQGARKVAFLGDALGGEDDEECCRLLMSEAELAVFGNREVRVRLPLADDVAAWVRALPVSCQIDGLLLCHSSPASLFPTGITAGEAVGFKRGRGYFQLFPYISGRAAASAAVRAVESACVGVVHGHTHEQALRKVRGGEVVSLGREKAVLGEGVVVAGIGSVGEGKGGRIEYALYERGERTLYLRSIDAA